MVRFQSSVKRSWWLGLALSVLIDFCFAYLVSVFFWSPGQAFLPAFLVLAAVYGVQLAYGAISAIKTLLLYLIEKDARVNRLKQLMTENEVPSSYGVYVDVEDFLYSLANSEDAPAKARFFAAASLGEISGIRQSNRPLLTMTTLMCIEAALERYDPAASPPP